MEPMVKATFDLVDGIRDLKRELWRLRQVIGDADPQGVDNALAWRRAATICAHVRQVQKLPDAPGLFADALEVLRLSGGIDNAIRAADALDPEDAS